MPIQRCKWIKNLNQQVLLRWNRKCLQRQKHFRQLSHSKQPESERKSRSLSPRLWLRRHPIFLRQEWTHEHVQHVDVRYVWLLQPERGQEHVKTLVRNKLGPQPAEHQRRITLGSHTTRITNTALQKGTLVHPRHPGRQRLLLNLLQVASAA